MEGIITAWGRILRGYSPSLSIEITRECPLRCPGCYAYGDEHLGGDVTLRQVTDYKGQELVDRVLAIVDEEKPIHVSIVGGEPLVRFRELERHPAAARGARHLHAARHERGPSDSRRMGVDSAPADRRLDRRPAAGARRAAHAGDLRSDPEAHRGPPDHRALHRHAAAGPARRLPRGVRPALVGEPERRGRSGSASTRRRSARSRRDPHAGRSRARRRRADVAAPPLPEDLAMPEGLLKKYARPAAESRTSASSRRPRPASRPTSSTGSRRASSAARPIARSAAASRRRGSPPSARIGCPAASASGRSSTRRSRSARPFAPGASPVRWANQARLPDILSGYMPRLRKISRRARSVREFVRGLARTDHPLLVHVVPIRRCNIDCGYCNEYDKVSPPVPTSTR